MARPVIAGTERYTAAEVAELAGCRSASCSRPARDGLQVPDRTSARTSTPTSRRCAPRRSPERRDLRRGDARGDPYARPGLSRSSERCVRSRFGSCSNPVSASAPRAALRGRGGGPGAARQPAVVSLLTSPARGDPERGTDCGGPVRRTFGRLLGGDRVLRRPRGLHTPGQLLSRMSSRAWHYAWRSSPARSVILRAPGQDDRRRGDDELSRAGAVDRRGTRIDRSS